MYLPDCMLFVDIFAPVQHFVGVVLGWYRGRASSKHLWGWEGITWTLARHLCYTWGSVEYTHYMSTLWKRNSCRGQAYTVYLLCTGSLISTILPVSKILDVQAVWPCASALIQCRLVPYNILYVSGFLRPASTFCRRGRYLISIVLNE